MARLLFALLVALLWSPASAPAQITGTPSVIDGDTIEVHGQRITLYGIDAPELGQICMAEGEPYACGEAAASALAEHIGTARIACSEKGAERGGEIVAVCQLVRSQCAMREDLSAWLVSQGWALADRRQSLDYVDEEAAARAAGRGLWRGEFAAPWDWRRKEEEDKG